MASSPSSCLAGFLRLGVPCVVPGSPLGGVGKLGATSTALALSSRNLSNSECSVEKRGERDGFRKRSGFNPT